MRRRLEYISVKIIRHDGNGKVVIQGTATIVHSENQYYLLTAYHCICKTDEDGKEIIPPDWKMMSAIAYSPKSEIQLEITGIEDVDQVNDWAVLKISKPSDPLLAETKIGFTTDVNYANGDVYAGYGFPHCIDDGIYLEFSPANSRGATWRIYDTVEGGNLKAITLEKGISGMGLFRSVNGKLLCLGIIHKSVKDGAMNAMRMISSLHFCKCFPNLFEGNILQEISQSSINQDSLSHQIEASELAEEQDGELWHMYMQKIRQADYSKALDIIERLHQQYPDNEMIWTNLLYATSLSEHLDKLGTYQHQALSFIYSQPNNVAFIAKVFAVKGYPNTAAELFYLNAKRMEDPLLDSLYYTHVVMIPELQEVARKEYDIVEEGKCVLYCDEHDRRHCWMVNRCSEMGEMLIGRRKDETINVSIAGESRKITIIAIYDKYFTIEHRALMDIKEHGGNKIMKPLVLQQHEGSEGLLEVLKSYIKDNLGGKSIFEKMQESYHLEPFLLATADQEDIVPSFYYMLFTDFQLIPGPEDLSVANFFQSTDQEFEYVLDLSSFLILSENYFSTKKGYKRKFIISKYLKFVIEQFCDSIMRSPSLLMHQVLSFSHIHRFSEDPKCDMELRIDALRAFIKDFCVDESADLPDLDGQIQTVKPLLFINTMSIMMNQQRVLISEDWHISELLNHQILMINSQQYLQMIKQSDLS